MTAWEGPEQKGCVCGLADSDQGLRGSCLSEARQMSRRERWNIKSFDTISTPVSNQDKRYPKAWSVKKEC